MAATTTVSTATKVAAVATLVLALACCATSAPTPAPEAATAPSPSGTNDCFMALTNMSDCLTFVEDGSNLTKPDKGCCPELAGLVEGNPICLCQLLGKPDSIGIKINVNKALKLPSICGVTTPPVSACAAVGVPVSLSPSMSPGMAPGAPDTSPSNEATSPSSGGPSPSSEEAAASPSGNKNRASGIQASALTFIFGLSTLCASVFF